MIELWIPITIAAAFLQNVRTSVQKHLKGRLSNTGATFVRFGFGFPLAILYVLTLRHLLGFEMPAANQVFFLYASIGGVSQILGTAALLATFGYRNFAVGTAYSKTETVQAALFAAIILGEVLTPLAAAGIAISLVGVLALSAARTKLTARSLLASLASRPAVLGIVSGGCFGISAVSYRAASLSLGGDGYLIQAAFTLSFVTILQTALMLLYMRLREPGQITAVLRAWRPAAWVGISGVVGSAGWFTAMTLQHAAYVRALGQIELIFTIFSASLIFRERITKTELGGIALMMAGILILVLGA